jgi:hypothetical protein
LGNTALGNYFLFILRIIESFEYNVREKWRGFVDIAAGGPYGTHYFKGFLLKNKHNQYL